MSDLPTTIEIHEEGPREGFQIEPGPISTADKIRVIEALAETGIAHIQVCSFVNPRLVPGWADAEAVVAGFKAKPGIAYTALWFNAAGLERALAFRDKLLADTMGWATPARIERTLGEVRARWPDKEIALHLHDTRGLAVANAHAGLKMGVRQFDSTVGGLGGCPFAGQKGAAGNICTEELVLLCEEMGIRTGIDLDRLIEVGRLAETVVGHQLPSELIHAGSLDAFRRKAA